MIEDRQSEVEFLDIIPGEEETRVVYKRSFSISKIKRIPYYMFQRKKHDMFLKVQKDMLGCMDELNYRVDYDAIMIGSDEVFNFVQSSPWGFSPQLYGSIDNENVNSYAACFGYTTLKDIENRGLQGTITLALSNLKHTSVRDQNSADIINSLTNRAPDLHFDPVIVGDLPIESLPMVNAKRYILVYSYDFRFSDKSIIKQIREIARKEKCKIYSVGFYQDWCDKNIVTDPIKLLSYFKNAEYIVTDTFHGTIFSIRCSKRFVTVIRESNKKKLQDLLIRLNMEHRIVSGQEDISNVLHKSIDYDAFEHLRLKERARSDDYIRLCLNKDE